MQFKRDFMHGKDVRISVARRISISGIIMSLYILIMFFTQNFAFGEFQIRIATSLYALSGIYGFLIIPLGIANLLSNTLMGGLGLLDMIGGMAAGIITATIIYLVKRWNFNDWFIAIPIIFGPGLMVPIWLSYITHIPYMALALSVCIGQIIPGIVGVLLIKQLRNITKR